MYRGDFVALEITVSFSKMFFTKEPSYAEKLKEVAAKVSALETLIKAKALSIDLQHSKVLITENVWKHLSKDEKKGWLLSFEVYFAFKLTDQFDEKKTITVFSKENITKQLASTTGGKVKIV